MSYRKEDLLSIAGELGLHCKGMDQEEIAAKVAAEVMKASFLVADDQEVLAFEAAIQRKCFHVTEDEWNTLEWLNDMGYLVSYSDDYAEVPAEVAAVYDQINTPECMYLHRQRPYMRCLSREKVLTSDMTASSSCIIPFRRRPVSVSLRRIS